MSSTLYSYFGCRLRSALPLAYVPACADQAGPADAVLTLAEIGEGPAEPIWSSPYLSIAPDGAALFQLPAVARILVRRGCEILIEPAPSAGAIEIETLLTGPVAGVLLHQRGILPLRASCVDHAGRAIALAGSSGCGKSTLAAALVRRGGMLIGDDVCALRLLEGEAPRILQGGSGLRLWPDARAALRLPCEWTPIRPGHAKQAARLQASDRGSRPLDAIVRLSPETGGARPGIRRLGGPRAAAPMDELVYQLSIGRALGRGRSLFSQVMRLAGTVPVHELRRPDHLNGIEEAVEWVIAAAGAR